MDPMGYIYIFRNIEQSNEIGRTEGQQIYMMMTTFVKCIIIFKTCILFVHMFNVKKNMETPATLPASIYRTDRVPILPFSQALPSAHALWRQIVPMRQATLRWTLKKYIWIYTCFFKMMFQFLMGFWWVLGATNCLYVNIVAVSKSKLVLPLC